MQTADMAQCLRDHFAVERERVPCILVPKAVEKTRPALGRTAVEASQLSSAAPPPLPAPPLGGLALYRLVNNRVISDYLSSEGRCS